MSSYEQNHLYRHNKGKYRILLVVRWPVGGIRTFIRYVYRHLEPELFHFTILGPKNPEMDVLAEDLQGLSVDFKEMSERPSAFEILTAIREVLRANKYDLIHSHGFTSGICAALPALLAKRPHILTSHDVINKKQFKGISGRLKKIIMSFALRSARAIHSVSYDANMNLLEYFPFLQKHTDKCITITHGIEIKRFSEAVKRNIKFDLGIGEETFLIGFLGRFMSQKGFRYLIEAIDHLSKKSNLPRQILVVAFGDGGFVREEKQKIMEKGLMEFFRFLPFVDNAASIIKGLDVVVMPSLWEACGLLAMETLICGTPLIGTNCIGLREVLRNTPSIVVDPKDSVALADAIEQVMITDLRELFVRFSSHAQKIFDVETTAKNIRQLYLDVLTG